MHTVYVLQSLKDPKRRYIGLTLDLEKRLKEHNQGLSQYTKTFLPWEVAVYIVFRNKTAAEKFERYLKSGSGRAFFKRHLVS